ncbi:MAG: transcription termination factor NusA [Patescibacteria group bacterium]|nr:transcription termination factor NusA [Patescibacteria group bacterium]
MSELSSAIRAVCEEKGLTYEAVVETIELSLAAAYRKDFGQKNQNIKVKFNPETGESEIMDVKTVVANLPEDYFDAEGKVNEKYRPKREEILITAPVAQSASTQTKAPVEELVSASIEGEEDLIKFNPKTEIQIKDALLIKKDAALGEEIITNLEVPKEYGRMAAQTAKQVIIQKLREAEREMVLSEFKGKEHEVVTGVVQRREGRNVLVDLGKAIGRLPMEEQIYGERYETGDKVKVYIKEVRSGSKGPEIILSRISDEILKKIFFFEIPEISNGLIEIKGVAREAGSRSKVAIWTDQENVDPIGSCVGQRGSRIQTIISELGGERIDMVKYDDDPARYVSNALSPAKVISVDLRPEERRALVKVLPEQLSLAIGKRGQNVRLAARLTGWKIDIMEEGDGTSAKISSEKIEAAPEEVAKTEATEEPAKEEVKPEEPAEEAKKEKKPSSAKASEDKPKKEKKVKAKKEKKSASAEASADKEE